MGILGKPDFSRGCAFVGGEFVPIEQAAIPITDTGFTRSDVTYDVVGVWQGHFFRLDDHLARFERGWRRLRMRPPIDCDAMRDVLLECVARSGLRDAYVEMIVTRGIPRDGDRDPRNFINRFYAFAIPYVWIAQPAHQLEGLSIVVAQSARRIPTSCVDPTVKNFHWGDLTQGLFEAYDRDAFTAVLLDVEDNVTEGPGFNIFGVESGRLLTPPDGVLEGITRDTVIELARRQGLGTLTEKFGADRLRACHEVFLTTTAGGIMPVTMLDGVAVGDGVPGAITMMLRERYWAAHEAGEWTTAVGYDKPGLQSAG
ncbi:MAG: aminotransferase class IV [Gammaproteobacteria bacterium]